MSLRAASIVTGLSLLSFNNLHAAETSPLQDATVKFALQYSQQTHGTTTLDIYGPSMGVWGRLGLSLGSSNYYLNNASEAKERYSAVEYAIAWLFEGEFFRQEVGDYRTSIGPMTKLEIGSLSYELFEQNKKRTKDFSFFAVQFGLQYSSYAKEPAARFIKSSQVGIGVGMRGNNIDQATYIGDAAVDLMHVFPSFFIGMFL